MESPLVHVDCAVLKDLELEVVIGLHAWEREQPQVVLADLEMRVDGRRAAASDDIQDTLNYETVALRLREAVLETRFTLLETLGQFIMTCLAREFGVEQAVVLLRKPRVVPHTQLAGVRITMGCS